MCVCFACHGLVVSNGTAPVRLACRASNSLSLGCIAPLQIAVPADNNRQSSQPPTDALCAGVRNNLLCCQDFPAHASFHYGPQVTQLPRLHTTMLVLLQLASCVAHHTVIPLVFLVLANAGRLHADACMAGLPLEPEGLGIGALQPFDQFRIGSRVPRICITTSFCFYNPDGMFASAFAMGSTSSVVQCILRPLQARHSCCLAVYTGASCTTHLRILHTCLPHDPQTYIHKYTSTAQLPSHSQGMCCCFWAFL